ncbi:uncharacterized protein [Drosophila virilis]|uniref:Uncharacterized protein n=1 Tax=Drosophila virilis TaxID=7244 RepID=B4LNT9_DROVI|nr:cyclin-dependent kinase 11B [Drosophila virilis]XP_032293167.1 cyclin-dependent kinase 11B [Drosophila virilis]EDW60159.2 uncharacterized protein Dvir_GJ21332 [Drosophila virilis]
MSCICQYIISSSSSTNGGGEPIAFPLSNANDNSAAAIGQEGPCDASMEPVSDDTKIAVCVSELADFRSENWLLKKKLEEHEVTIQNLEHLMTTIMNKQHKMLAEVLQLRKRNQELQNECNLQREYHAMERNALIKEIYDLKNRDQMCALSAEEDESNSSMNSQDEYGEQIETDSDEAKLCYEHDSDGMENEEDGDDGEDEHSAGSSAESSAPSSHNGSMYSADSDTYETDESEDEEQESQHEQGEYSTGTDSESD